MTFIVRGKTKDEVVKKLDEVMNTLTSHGNYDEHRAIIQSGDDEWKGIGVPVFHKDKLNCRR